MNRVLVLSLVTACIAGTANAQYKPAAGERTLEVNFAPLGGSPVSIAGIKYRSFGSETSAFRLGVFVGFNSTTTILQDENGTVSPSIPELKEKESGFNISIQPGIEKHFAGTDRLSPYIGGVLSLGYSATSSNKEDDHLIGGSYQLGYEKEKGGSLNLGLNAIAGVDYYIAQHLYMGTEIGFGVGLNKDLKNTVETSGPNQDNTALETKESESNVNNESSFRVGPNVIGQIRLGWVF